MGYVDNVSPSAGLGSSLFDTIQVSIMKVSNLPLGYGYLTVFLFSIPFGSIYHARTFIRRLNHPSINMV
jgi:hypothetical protein